nr:periplasmic heavy metal sensor [Oceanococcus sp. HetDA_MAG_MS8]
MWISKPWLIAVFLILGLSLGANFFLSGLMLGHKRGPGPVPPIAQHLKDSLPTAARPLMRRQLLAQRKDLLDIRTAHRNARQAVAQALRQDPFDPERMRVALEHMRESTDAAQQRLHASVVEVAKALPPADRHRWAEQWEGPPRRPGVLSQQRPGGPPPAHWGGAE